MLLSPTRRKQGAALPAPTRGSRVACHPHTLFVSYYSVTTAPCPTVACDSLSHAPSESIVLRLNLAYRLPKSSSATESRPQAVSATLVASSRNQSVMESHP